MEHILVIGNKEIQKNMVYQMGISEENYCDCGKNSVEQWLMERTSGLGADIFFECVGKNETYNNQLSLYFICLMHKLINKVHNKI